MIYVVVVLFFIVQATGGIDSGFAEASGNFLETSTWGAADVEEPVAIVGIEQFHDMGGIGLARKVEVDFQQLGVRIPGASAYAVEGECFFVESGVAETGLQQIEGVESAGKEGQGQKGAVGVPGLCREVESEAEAD